MHQIIVSFLIAILVLSGCDRLPFGSDNPAQLVADVQTPPVQTSGDHMDDAAIYVNQKNPSNSFVIATNKHRTNGGLHVYDLEGKELNFYQDGRMNNVDIRYGFDLAGRKIDIAVATERNENRMAVYEILPEQKGLRDITSDNFTFAFEPYGGCLYHSKKTGKFYFFATSKEGRIDQVELIITPQQTISGKVVRTLTVGSQCEGLAAEDDVGVLFVGEENEALWKYDAEVNGEEARVKIDGVGKNLKADIEGVCIYAQGPNKGYIIVSSQGNNSYVLYNLQPPHDFIGRFVLIDTNNIEGTEQTDGISVTHHNLGPKFPNGLFVAHDNRSRKRSFGDQDGSNLKFVAWQKIANALALK